MSGRPQLNVETKRTVSANLRVLDMIGSPYVSDTDDHGVFSASGETAHSSPTSLLSPDSSAVSVDVETEKQYLCLYNCSLAEGGKLYPGAVVVVDRKSGKIVKVETDGSEAWTDVWGQSADDTEVMDLDGAVLSAGFVEAQLNGAFGLDFSDSNYGDGSKEAFAIALNNVQRQLLRTGVTSYCPTLPSTYPHVYKKVLPLLRAKRIDSGAESLGYHLEGPFLSPKKPGCHPQDAIITAPDGYKTFETVYGGEDNVRGARVITVAAEQDGVMEAIPELTKRGPVVALGHSVIDYAGGCKAVRNGAKMITHIYNAMRQPHHRETGLWGVIGAPIEDIGGVDKRPYFGVIADGVHVAPSGVNIVYNTFPDGCCLVTDAMFPMGLPNGTYAWGKQAIEKKGLYLHLDGTDTIAGAGVELDTCVRNLMKWAHIPIEAAIKCATTNPANVLGVLGTKGTVAPGADADLVVLSPSAHVRKVFKLGKLEYSSKKPVA
jgi:N-acetylglucosamine-6-phosphate deacetylase